MKKALIGAGGFADEIKAHMKEKNMKCFIDEEYYFENDDNIFSLKTFDPHEFQVVIAIGDPKKRYEMYKRLPENTKYFSFIHPSSILLSENISIGEGSIICAGVIITTNCKIGKHSQLNLQTTIGHDCEIGDFFTTAPGVKISGHCKIGNNVYIGTNSSTKQKINICDNTTIGLNSGVVKDIITSGTYVGTPCLKIR